MTLRVPQFVVRWLLRWAYGVADSRDPDLVIGPRKNPYLLRWYVTPRSAWAGICLHIFKRDDDDRALHDHPYPSLSIALKGRIREVYAQRGFDPRDKRQHSVRMIGPGEIRLRRADFAHRIELVDGLAMTIFITFAKSREWGFWCLQGWRHNKEFTGEGTGLPGPGCD